MKFLCPYCKARLSDPPPATCPVCARTMNLPGHVVGRTATERKRAKDKIRSAAARERRAIGGRSPPIGRKPIHLVLILAVMVMIGGMFVARTRSPLRSQIARTEEDVCADELRALRIAVERFKADCGRYPDTSEGPKALIIDPGEDKWQGPYATLVKNDPWGHAYIYEQSSNAVIVLSRGPDGKRDTADDLFPEDWRIKKSEW